MRLLENLKGILDNKGSVYNNLFLLNASSLKPYCQNKLEIEIFFNDASKI